MALFFPLLTFLDLKYAGKTGRHETMTEMADSRFSHNGVMEFEVSWDSVLAVRTVPMAIMMIAQQNIGTSPSFADVGILRLLSIPRGSIITKVYK